MAWPYAEDVMFLLHAEHEMNCSTAAARHLASSGVDVWSAVAGAVGKELAPARPALHHPFTSPRCHLL